MATKKLDQKAALAKLNRILEAELAGVVRYTHYAFMVFGYNRIPIIHWLESQAAESLTHARRAGELITHFGGEPSLAVGPLLKSQKNDVGAILREALEHERGAQALYRDLATLAAGRSIILDEYAREQIATEELHAGEIEKMLRRPG